MISIFLVNVLWIRQLCWEIQAGMPSVFTNRPRASVFPETTKYPHPLCFQDKRLGPSGVAVGARTGGPDGQTVVSADSHWSRDMVCAPS